MNRNMHLLWVALLCVCASGILPAHVNAETKFLRDEDVQRQLNSPDESRERRLPQGPAAPASYIPAPNEITRSFSSIGGILLADFSGTSRVYVFTTLQIDASSGITIGLISGESRTFRIGEVKGLIRFEPAFAATGENAADRLLVIEGQHTAKIPDRLADAGDLAALKDSMQELAKLEAKVPEAADALSAVHRALDTATLRYSSGQVYAMGRWMTQVEFKQIRLQASVESFKRRGADADLNTFINSYVSVYNEVKSRTDLALQVHDQAFLIIRSYMVSATSDVLARYSDIVAKLGLNEGERAELLCIGAGAKNLEYSQLKLIVRELTPVAGKNVHAAEILKQWKAREDLENQLYKGYDNSLALIQQLSKAESVVYISERLGDGTLKGFLADLDKCRENKPYAPGLAKMEDAEGLIKFSVGLSMPANRFASGKGFSARELLRIMRRRLAQSGESDLKSALGDLCDRLEKVGDDGKWFSQAILDKAAAAAAN